MKNNKFEDVIKTEMELAEVLLGLLKQQQNAIIHFRDTELTSLIEQQHHILRPLEALEKERVNLTNEVVAQELNELQPSRGRLKNVVQQILDVNKQNKVLLENSLRFIQQNIKILTDDYTKKLIDAKV